MAAKFMLQKWQRWGRGSRSVPSACELVRARVTLIRPVLKAEVGHHSQTLSLELVLS